MRILLITAALLFLDQWTKHLARLRLRGGEIPVLPGFFNLDYVENTGAAWGILVGWNNWLLLFSMAVLVVLVRYRHSFLDGSVWTRVGFGLLLSGILGNLLDRAKFGYVIDFLHFFWRDHDFPAFNIADAAICAGVGVYLLVSLFPRRPADGVTPEATRPVPAVGPATPPPV